MTALKFESLKEFRPEPGDQVFRWSLGSTIVPTVIFALLFLVGAWQTIAPLKAVEEIPIFVRGLSTTGFLFFAWVAWAQTKAGFGESSLVACVGRDYLWVKYRSPLNSHIGRETDTQVVGIPLSSIAWTQSRTVKTVSRRANGKHSTRTVDSLDLGMTERFDWSSLTEHLSKEREKKKKATQSHQHFPLRILDDKSLRVDLYNVAGGSKALQKALPSSIATREPSVEVIENSSVTELS